jgi:rhodanese-related sulfurtransferase
MYFKQFYLGCLAHASYLIGSDGEAAVVDPQRDIDQYLEEADAQGLKIRYVIETHVHADFVSGHRELAARTGAEIVFSQKAGNGYLRDGIEAWRGAGFELSMVSQASVDELHSLIDKAEVQQILDVRRQPEYEGGHVPLARHAPLSELRERAAALPFDRSKPTAVICAGGYRSSAATSILAQQGFSNLLNVIGGTTAWINQGYPVERQQ